MKKAFFRIPLGRGRYLSVFSDCIWMEWYHLITGDMVFGKVVVQWWNRKPLKKLGM